MMSENRDTPTCGYKEENAEGISWVCRNGWLVPAEMSMPCTFLISPCPVCGSDEKVNDDIYVTLKEG